ncbi:hypothetical protein ACFWIQ_36650 [Kitasatospora sp. NPDC127059]|uniref:hypothetical protein n=1 Tax=unclassified Kitasatospora TaxID=2633591 RepID=UPI0036532B12
MMPNHSPLPALRSDADGETLDALVSSSRRLRRFWPQVTAGPEPATPASVGVRVPSGAQRLVAGMAEYGM